MTKEFAKHEVVADIVQVAPFSEDGGDCQPGFGLEALVDATVRKPASPAPFWASTPPTAERRAFLGYRRDR